MFEAWSEHLAALLRPTPEGISPKAFVRVRAVIDLLALEISGQPIQKPDCRSFHCAQMGTDKGDNAEHTEEEHHPVPPAQHRCVLRLHVCSTSVHILFLWLMRLWARCCWCSGGTETSANIHVLILSVKADCFSVLHVHKLALVDLLVLMVVDLLVLVLQTQAQVRASG